MSLPPSELTTMPALQRQAPAQPLSIPIKSSDRVFFAGRTGSGKTTLAKSLLRAFPDFVVLDPKHRFTMAGIPIVKDFHKEAGRQIVRVPFPKRGAPRTYEREKWLDILYRIWKVGNRIVYVDELTLITPSKQLPADVGRVIRTGRERGLGFWSASQRPKEIPPEVYTEAEHIFAFQLNWISDQQKVGQFASSRFFRLIRHLEGHEFAYFNVRENREFRCEPISPRE